MALLPQPSCRAHFELLAAQLTRAYRRACSSAPARRAASARLWEPSEPAAPPPSCPPRRSGRSAVASATAARGRAGLMRLTEPFAVATRSGRPGRACRAPAARPAAHAQPCSCCELATWPPNGLRRRSAPSAAISSVAASVELFSSSRASRRQRPRAYRSACSSAPARRAAPARLWEPSELAACSPTALASSRYHYRPLSRQRAGFVGGGSGAAVGSETGRLATKHLVGMRQRVNRQIVG